jgi:hypothetical protein
MSKTDLNGFPKGNKTNYDDSSWVRNNVLALVSVVFASRLQIGFTLNLFQYGQIIEKRRIKPQTAQRQSGAFFMAIRRSVSLF